MKKIIVKKSNIKNAGKGVFAGENINKDDLIGIFKGFKVNADGIHVLWLDEDHAIEVTNDMKYVNHSKNPNAGLWGVELYAIKDIKKNEEIFFDYNEEVEDLFGENS